MDNTIEKFFQWRLGEALLVGIDVLKSKEMINNNIVFDITILRAKLGVIYNMLRRIVIGKKMASFMKKATPLPDTENR